MIQVRRLGAGDPRAPRLAQAFAEHPASAGDVQAWLKESNHILVGAWDGTTPVGMAFGYHLPRFETGKRMSLMYSIDVAEAYRRQGIGSEIMRVFRQVAPGETWLVTNTSNVPAMALYRRGGAAYPASDDVVVVFPES